MLYPVIDIGSNTVKIAVLDEEVLFKQAPVFFKAVPLNIKSKIRDMYLPDDAVEELAELIKSFAEIANRLTKNPPLAFATASLRGLQNMQQVLKRVEEVSGVHVEVISGETEAYYSFLGARGCVSAKAGISVDLGGGSTELLAFAGNKVVGSVSLPFGCLTLYHAYFEGEAQNPLGCEELIQRHLSEAAPDLPGNTILLSGGSAKAVLRYKNILENKKNCTLTDLHFKEVIDHFYNGDPTEKRKIEDVLKDRYRLIPPAVAVFTRIMKHYGKDRVLVCRSGVREGRLFHYLEKNQ
ncbi:MAG: hypothetical protein IJC26_08055 [Clostridia bacterium]|nr:hypothetical protein [Clostridia bacterium]